MSVLNSNFRIRFFFFFCFSFILFVKETQHIYNSIYVKVYKLKEARIIYEINGVVFNTKPQHSSLCADTLKKKYKKKLTIQTYTSSEPAIEDFILFLSQLKQLKSDLLRRRLIY